MNAPVAPSSVSGCSSASAPSTGSSGVALFPLSRGQHALVDADLVEWLSQWTWVVAKQADGGYYAVTRIYVAGKQQAVPMHRLIAEAKNGQVVDHINGDRLDNRFSNLRACAQAENVRNRKRHKNNTSGFKGVSPRGDKWRANIGVDGKLRALGEFDDPISAAVAYDAAARQHYGDYAKLNFDPKRDWLFVVDGARTKPRRQSI